MWLDSSQTATRTLLLCVRTRIHPNIEEKQGQMQLYQQLHRHGMQDRSRSREENLKPESNDGSWHQARSNSSTALMIPHFQKHPISTRNKAM